VLLKRCGRLVLEKKIMNNNELPWHMREPDYSQSIWISVEERLGRKLSPEENERIFKTSGMRKEWFFNRLKQCANLEEAEDIVATMHMNCLGDEAIQKINGKYIIIKKPKQPSLWKRLLKYIVGN
jgi:hypothetical protein